MTMPSALERACQMLNAIREATMADRYYEVKATASLASSKDSDERTNNVGIPLNSSATHKQVSLYLNAAHDLAPIYRTEALDRDCVRDTLLGLWSILSVRMECDWRGRSLSAKLGDALTLVGGTQSLHFQVTSMYDVLILSDNTFPHLYVEDTL